MAYRILHIILFATFFVQAAVGQRKKLNVNRFDTEDSLRAEWIKEMYNLEDTVFLVKNICKQNSMIKLSPLFTTKMIMHNSPEDKSEFLTVHGNVLYNYSYRSFIDTPFAQRDLMQHMVQTNIGFVIQNKYPVNLTITTRKSNSPYFQNFTDVNVHFDKSLLLNKMKEDLIKQIPSMIDLEPLEKIKRSYDQRKLALDQLQAWISSPQRAQEMVEEKKKLQNRLITDSSREAFLEKLREEANANTKPSFDLDSSIQFDKKFKFTDQAVAKRLQKLKDSSINIDKLKIDSSYFEKYAAKKAALEKAKSEVKGMATNIMKESKKLQDSISQLKSQINRISESDSLLAFYKKHHIDQDKLTKAQKFLLMVKKLGIGRSWVDYSELTVKNVSVSGGTVELTPGKFYVAAAAGKLNYRFRDFIVRNPSANPQQSLYAIRAGVGKKDRNNVIATFYNGEKSVLGNSTAGRSPLQRVMGISLEGRWVLNNNTYLVGEVAKSSYPSNAQPTGSNTPIGKVFNLSTHENEAASIRLFTSMPASHTHISAFYRKAGKRFNSFNLFPANIDQEAWSLKVKQSFLKNKLVVDGGLRKNDFVSGLADTVFASKTIFKSLQVTLKIPKYPFVSVGYYPSSQIMVRPGNLLTESQYNTLNAVVSHNYKAAGIGMNSNLLLTRFYNDGSDTGFVYFNATTVSINQTLFVLPFTFIAGAAITSQKQFHLVTLESQCSYNVGQFLSLTAGLKLNRLNHAHTVVGAIGALNLYIKRLGTFQFNYDKTYLPGSNRLLLPVDMGRVSFYREF